MSDDEREWCWFPFVLRPPSPARVHAGRLAAANLLGRPACNRRAVASHCRPSADELNGWNVSILGGAAVHLLAAGHPQYLPRIRGGAWRPTFWPPAAALPCFSGGGHFKSLSWSNARGGGRGGPSSGRPRSAGLILSGRRPPSRPPADARGGAAAHLLAARSRLAILQWRRPTSRGGDTFRGRSQPPGPPTGRRRPRPRALECARGMVSHLLAGGALLVLHDDVQVDVALGRLAHLRAVPPSAAWPIF